MNKTDYKAAMNSIKASDEFKKKTYDLLNTNLMKPQTKKEVFIMNSRKNRMVKWGAGLVAGLAVVLIVGVWALNQNPKGEIALEPTVEAPAVLGKVNVNIQGEITEVGTDGMSFKVGDLWVMVTADTVFGSQEPTAAKEQLVDKEFKVGNTVAGYTSEDITSGKVTAVTIYNNFSE